MRLDPDQHETRLLAFAVVTTLAQWAALFITRLTLDRAAFEENLGHGVQDAWEKKTCETTWSAPSADTRRQSRAEDAGFEPARVLTPNTISNRAH